MSVVGFSGAALSAPERGRVARLTPQQIRRRRWDDWLHDHEQGRYDPATGRSVPRPVWLIAALAGVPERTVRAGIAEARRLRAEIRAAPD